MRRTSKVQRHFKKSEVRPSRILGTVRSQTYDVDTVSFLTVGDGLTVKRSDF